MSRASKITLGLSLAVLVLIAAWVSGGGWANRPAFVNAVKNGHYWRVRAMLAYDAELARPSYKTDPLLVAARRGHWDVAKLIMAKGGASVRFAREVLELAFQTKDNDLIRYCLMPERFHLGVGFQAASYYDNFEIMDFCLKEGITPRHIHFKQAAFQAAVMGKKENLEYFIKNGFNSDQDKASLLLGAAIGKKRSAIEFVLDNGGSFSSFKDIEKIQDTYSFSYIIYSTELMGMCDVEDLKFCIEKGFDLHRHKNSMLLWAAHMGKKETAAYLLDQGADIDADNGEPMRRALRGSNPVWHFSDQRACEATARLLIERGANLDLLDPAQRAQAEALMASGAPAGAREAASASAGD